MRPLSGERTKGGVPRSGHLGLSKMPYLREDVDTVLLTIRIHYDMIFS